MKQSIQLRLGQHLTMTPQLQQAIRLLQLSTVELQMEIQQALDSNLMLEAVEGDGGDEGPVSAEAERAEVDRREIEAGEVTRNETAESDSRAEADSEADFSSPEQIPDELAVDSDWDAIYDSGATSLSAEDRFSGGTEVDLSPTGRWQAERLAARLADDKITAIYCSSMRRTVETATLLARFVGPAGEQIDLLAAEIVSPPSPDPAAGCFGEKMSSRSISLESAGRNPSLFRNRRLTGTEVAIATMIAPTTKVSQPSSSPRSSPPRSNPCPKSRCSR